MPHAINGAVLVPGGGERDSAAAAVGGAGLAASIYWHSDEIHRWHAVQTVLLIDLFSMRYTKEHRHTKEPAIHKSRILESYAGTNRAVSYYNVVVIEASWDAIRRKMEAAVPVEQQRPWPTNIAFIKGFASIQRRGWIKEVMNGYLLL